MKFCLKITLCMLCLLSLLFGIGGSVLISISFQTSLEHENTAARETYQMLLNTLRVVNRIETWSDSDDISHVLSQLLSEKASSWSALRITAKSKTVYENGVCAEFTSVSKENVKPKFNLMSGFLGSDGQQYLQISGAFVMGKETLYLDALRNITPIYKMQSRQMEMYQKIYICMVLICMALTYSISWLLTRPLVKLSQASQEIAGGNLSYRSAIKSGDEVGALSSDFDYMASQMEKSIEELKDAMERQERFVRSFTHELKTPMASIIGNADLLRLQALTPNEQSETANYIFKAGKRLESLSIRLLEIFVMENQKPRLMETSIKTLIEKIAVSTTLAEKDIEITTKCEDGTCYIEPDLIWSLLVNLIDNAKKAIEHAGQINIICKMTEEGCRICVADNGKGIPPDAMKHVTEAFFRVDKARSSKQSGAGLGLALCAKIVELHNGTMTFSSKVGKGTCVTVELKGGRT